ncbi:hypothetical protein Pan258_21770 [Symmachiella dynata]|nr:hypothetical protein Pan258_21770 [Symmachiella dynata]
MTLIGRVRLGWKRVLLFYFQDFKWFLFFFFATPRLCVSLFLEAHLPSCIERCVATHPTFCYGTYLPRHGPYAL